MNYDADILEFPTQTKEDKYFNKMAESLGHPISNEERDWMRPIYYKIEEKLRECVREYDKKRSKELKAMDKDPSLVQNDKSFKDFKQYLEELPPKIQQAALDLLQDSYRNKSN